MIKAIVFDCFGVLTTDAWKQIWSHASLDEKAQLHAHEIDQQVNRGEISYEEFIYQITLLIGLSEEDIRARFDANEANTQLLNYIRISLKPHYKIGLLSNAADNWLSQLFTRQQVTLFDAVTLSYQLGVTKPDARIYHDIITKLGVRYDECVFVDDRAKYVRAAAQLGMIGIEYNNYETLIGTLEAILYEN